jgi:hypothetical protein
MAALVLAGLLASAIGPATAAADSGDGLVRADLDGVAIELILVGKYQCHDLDYPRIHCFSSGLRLNASIQAALSVQAVDYVQVFESPFYGGASLLISQDYTVLATLGWNDRISSFKGKNSQSGRFWTDWFYGGSSYAFCCNQQVASLGAFDNTFSSVQRT